MRQTGTASERIETNMVGGLGMLSGGAHAGRYEVTCHRVRDLVPLLSAGDNRYGQWRRTYGDDVIRAAIDRKVIDLVELRSLLRWRDHVDNLLVNTGRDEYLSRLWKASGYTAAHFLGLIDGTTPTIAAGDTMASHAGWTEFTEYDVSSGDRKSVTAALGSVSSQSLATSAIPLYITSNGLDCNGAFTTTSAQVGATGGTLITAGTFSQGNKSVDDGDLLNVTLTFTMAAA